MMRLLRWLFRLRWETTVQTRVITCRGCNGFGQVDITTQEPVKWGTGNTIDHLACGGMGWRRIPV